MLGCLAVIEIQTQKYQVSLLIFRSRELSSFTGPSFQLIEPTGLEEFFNTLLFPQRLI